MTVTWLDPTQADDASWQAAARRGLRLVGAAGNALPGAEGEDGDDGEDGEWGLAPRTPPLIVVPARRHGAAGRRRCSAEVRRRRTLLAVMGLLLIALALPLSGTGGYSHPAGSARRRTGARSSIPSSRATHCGRSPSGWIRRLIPDRWWPGWHRRRVRSR